MAPGLLPHHQICLLRSRREEKSTNGPKMVSAPVNAHTKLYIPSTMNTEKSCSEKTLEQIEMAWLVVDLLKHQELSNLL
jgi:hypothetical protein